MESKEGRAHHDDVTAGDQASMAPKASRALDAAVERIRFLEWRLAQVEETLAAERRALCTQRDALRSAEARHEEDAKTIEDLKACLARTPQPEADEANEADGADGADGAEFRTQSAPQSAPPRAPELNFRTALDHAEARIEFLEQSREHIFRRLVQWQRAADASNDTSVDLGEFIAELRAEIVALSKENAAASVREAELRSQLEAAGLTPLPSSVPGPTPPVSDRPRRRIGFVTMPPVAIADEGEVLPHPESVPDNEASDPPSAHRFHAGPSPSEARPSEARPSETPPSETPPSGTPPTEARPSTASPPEALAPRKEGPDASESRRPVEIPAEGTLSASARRLVEEVRCGRTARARLVAAEDLVDRAGRLAAWPLVSALTSSRDAQEQSTLLRLIARSGNRDVVHEVMSRARSSSPLVRAAAWDAAIRLASDDQQVLRAAIDNALADEDARVRRRAVLSLAALDAPGLPDRLIPLIFDPDAQTRRVVCVALGAFDTAATRRALASVLLDEAAAVRTAAASALGRMLGENLEPIALAQDLVRRRAVSRLRARLVLDEAIPTPMNHAGSSQRPATR
ncbi:MAG: HEAT repeat domain-containing protein [Deltaproteobacteria bacterium]|nr:HEAT repeat domain-containing protein [Deltaproteobacteria bacterium]